MNKLTKKKLIKQRRDLILGAKVIDCELSLGGFGGICHLKNITLKNSDGDEFVVKPFDWRSLHIIQVYWGLFG